MESTTTATVPPGLKLCTQNAHEYSTTGTDVVNNQHERSDENILKRVLNKVGFGPNTKTVSSEIKLCFYLAVTKLIL